MFSLDALAPNYQDRWNVLMTVVIPSLVNLFQLWLQTQFSSFDHLEMKFREG